jgi:tetratricopeptide (TPR) repeat protein
MNPDNLIVKLCIEGTQAEFQGQVEIARSLYRKAWEAVQNDYDACIAAHYVARHQDDPNERLRWNRIALDSANAAPDAHVRDFYPSLFLNMGQSYELLGNLDEAKRYYDLAAGLGIVHQGG